MNSSDNQPDWAAIAEKFDLWLPQIAPVGEALLEGLAARPGDRIIDLGSGTGEPALTLARRMQGRVDITGVDSAGPMVDVARRKVADEGLAKVRFLHMPAEQLDFADGSFDRAMSRFGVMLFNDPQQGLKEIQRVLKPGGHFSLAVWSTPETMPTLRWSYDVFSKHIAEDAAPPLHKVTSLGRPGVLEAMLAKAGFSEFSITPHTFHYRFESFDAYWDIVEASDILKQQYDALPKDQHAAIREEIAVLANIHMSENGLVIPHEFLLATGVK